MKEASASPDGWMSMNPPPPMLPASGKVTARAKAVATAASTALPPLWRISAPTREAGAETETTRARPWTAEPWTTSRGWAGVHARERVVTVAMSAAFKAEVKRMAGGYALTRASGSGTSSRAREEVHHGVMEGTEEGTE